MFGCSGSRGNIALKQTELLDTAQPPPLLRNPVTLQPDISVQLRFLRSRYKASTLVLAPSCEKLGQRNGSPVLKVPCLTTLVEPCRSALMPCSSAARATADFDEGWVAVNPKRPVFSKLRFCRLHRIILNRHYRRGVSKENLTEAL